MASKDKREQDKETFSRPIFVVPQAFNSLEAQYVANKCFDGMDRSLYFFGGHFINRGMSEENLAAVQAAVNGRFEEFVKAADGEIGRIKHLLRERGIVKVPKANYTAAKTIDLRVSNPLSSKFIELIKKLDQVCFWIDYAWFTQTINPKQRADALYSYRNALRKLAVTVRQDQNYILRKLRDDLKKTNDEKSDAVERRKNAKARDAVPIEVATKKAEGVMRSAEIKKKSEDIVAAKA